MNRRSFRYKWLASLLLFIALETLSLLMINESSFFQSIKISRFSMSVGGGLSKTINSVKYYFNLKDVNNTLAKENQQLLNLLEKYRDADINTDSIPNAYEYIPAKIVTSSVNNKHNFIILNKGAKDGVQTDMGVITPMGVVGIITKVSDKYSYIVSLLNINQSVSARLGRGGVFGPLIWDGKGVERGLLTDIPQHINYAIGDTIFTSGYSRIFPENIPLGTAGRHIMVGGTHKKIVVRLFIDFRKLKYVTIIKNRDKEELENLISK